MLLSAYIRKLTPQSSAGSKLLPQQQKSFREPKTFRESGYGTIITNLTAQIASHTAVLVTVSSGSCTGHPPVPLVPALLVARMNLHHAKMVVAEPSMYLASKRNFS